MTSDTKITDTNVRFEVMNPKQAQFETVNGTVFECFSGVCSKHYTITGLLIKEKAPCIALEGQEFSASSGWLDSWRKHPNIKSVTLSGEGF